MKRDISHFLQDNDQIQNKEPANISEYYNSNLYNLNCVKKTSFEGIHPSPSKRIMSPTIIRFVSPTSIDTYVNVSLTSDQTENIRRESEYFANIFNNHRHNHHDNNSDDDEASCYNNDHNNNMIMIEEDNVQEAGYLLGVIADIPPLTDLTALPWKFNLILAKISAKWMIGRFIEFFTKLMDREIAKICDVRSCNVIMISGDNEGIFIPHPKKPNMYISVKNNKASTIELVSSSPTSSTSSSFNDHHSHNIIQQHYAWELSIGVRQSDGKTAIGKVSFPCEENTLLQDCYGSWDGHDIKFKLAYRDDKYIKAFISISELILSYQCYADGMYIRGRADIVTILKHHQELWSKAVFDRLFSKDELDDFVMQHCQPKL